MITGKELINGYYEDEKLYSTGNDYLDELLERAFCEGYEYAQREFAKKEEKKKDTTKSSKNKKQGSSEKKPTRGRPRRYQKKKR